MPQGTKDLLILLAIGTQLDAVLLGHDQRHFQNIDGIQSQSFSIEGCIRIDILRLYFEVQCLHEQRGKFPLETDIGQRRRLLHERRFVGHRVAFNWTLVPTLYRCGAVRQPDSRAYADFMQAPHPPLHDYYAQEAQRSGWVRQLFDRTAGDYDRIERVMALGSGSWYRRMALGRAGLQPGMRVLDIGVGTGLMARQAAQLVGESGQVTGVDPSAGMIQSAKVPPAVKLLMGSAETIPAGSGTADFLCMGYALRHIADLSAAFREFLRVLIPGGRICLLEITRPGGRVRHALLKGYMRGVVPVLAGILGANPDSPKLMRYYWDTIDACAAPSEILAAMGEAGFVEVQRHVALGIFSEYCARKPIV
jgi:demethylmenaquinone methyltransferase / 2-methoxy-6-polyprenyl-1,4-benzoquinol methylase